MIRVLCGIIIILGFAYLGRMCAEKEKSRLFQLDSFCDGLNMLEFNIRYMSLPMYEALEKAGECCIEPVKSVFATASEALCGEDSISSGEAFCRGVEKHRSGITLSEDEIEILKSFSLSLGRGDRESEIVNIQAAKIRLSESCRDARDEINRKAKAVKGISTLIGVFVVIVLF